MFVLGTTSRAGQSGDAKLTRDIKVISSAGARALADACIAWAERNKLVVAMSIIDWGGNVIDSHAMEGAPANAIDTALLKAQSALRWRRATSETNKLVRSGENLAPTFMNDFPQPGALPIVLNGQVIGAMGVSSADGETLRAGGDRRRVQRGGEVFAASKVRRSLRSSGVAAEHARPTCEFGEVRQRPAAADILAPCVDLDIEQVFPRAPADRTALELGEVDPAQREDLSALNSAPGVLGKAKRSWSCRIRRRYADDRKAGDVVFVVLHASCNTSRPNTSAARWDASAAAPLSPVRPPALRRRRCRTPLRPSRRGPSDRSH